MMNRKILLSLVLGAFALTSAHAQVTIGSSYKPEEGALLQLKENESEGANSFRGLLLPRVDLEDRKKLSPLAANSEAQDYVGAVVYNTKDPLLEPVSACDPTPTTLGVTKGLKVWTGEEWADLDESKELNVPPEWISDDVRFIKDHEGNVYPVKKFGDEGYWMLENLRTKSFPTGRSKYPVEIGTSVLFGSDIENTIKLKRSRYQFPAPPAEYKPYFGDEVYPPISDDTFFKRYPNVGLLYNYFMTLNGESPQQTESVTIDGVQRIAPTKDANGRPNSFIRGICPKGWHVPYNQEFVSLFDYIREKFEAGDFDASGIDKEFLEQNPGKVDLQRYPLTNCLPEGLPELTRGASRIALKGGFAAMWIGADSPFRSTALTPKDDTVGPKEYGILAVFCSVYDFIRDPALATPPTHLLDTWVGNVWIRPADSAVSSYGDWTFGKAYHTNMYPVRCKKNDASDTGILTYQDVYNSN